MSARGMIDTNDATFDVRATALTDSVKGDFIVLSNTATNVTVGVNMVGPYTAGDALRRFTVRHNGMEVDALAANWAVGQKVYLTLATPLAPVTPTADGLNTKLIGRVIEPANLTVDGKLKIEFDGRNL